MSTKWDRRRAKKRLVRATKMAGHMSPEERIAVIRTSLTQAMWDTVWRAEQSRQSDFVLRA